MKAEDTILLNKTTTQNAILARRAWFWHVASHILSNNCKSKYFLLTFFVSFNKHNSFNLLQ